MKRGNKHFNDGYSSYPNKRINYPDNEEDEKDWLSGYYRCQREYEINMQNIGQDTYLWDYKKG